MNVNGTFPACQAWYISDPWFDGCYVFVGISGDVGCIPFCGTRNEIDEPIMACVSTCMDCDATVLKNDEHPGSSSRVIMFSAV